MLQAIRVFAVTSVLGAARRLHVSGFPGFRAERAQEGRGVRRARADFHVVGLQQRAALLVPVILQRQDDLLKGKHVLKPARFAKCRILRVLIRLRHPISQIGNLCPRWCVKGASINSKS